MKEMIIGWGTLILGLIGAVAFFVKEEYWISGILLAIILILIIFYYYIQTRPIWEIVSYSQELKITNSAHNATLKKEVTLKANHKGNDKYLHRNILADGTISNFRDSNNTPWPNGYVTERANVFSVVEIFPKHLDRWEKINSCLIWDIKDGFPHEVEEGTSYLVDFKTKVANFTITLPEDKPAQSVRAILNLNGENTELHKPTLNSDGTLITWTKKNLKPGGEYEIAWKWAK